MLVAGLFAFGSLHEVLWSFRFAGAVAVFSLPRCPSGAAILWRAAAGAPSRYSPGQTAFEFGGVLAGPR